MTEEQSEDQVVEAEDEAAESGGDHEPAPPATRELPRGSRPMRYLFFFVWMFSVPAALAILAVRLLKPKPFAVDAGVIRTFIGEQQVPATILFFTAFAAILWRLRHRLPLAGSTGVMGRSDLSPRLRARYDAAAQLIDEARRIMRLKEAEVKRDIKRVERDKITKAIDRLEDAMTADKFREDRFNDAAEALEALVGKHLKRWLKSEAREYIESITVAVLVALVLRFFVIEAFKIPSGSMIPTLMIGDHIFVAKYSYGPLLPRSDRRLYERLPPARGDVMVFKFPENKEQDFIKRAIALPGDTLEVLDGRPIINGFLAPSCYVGQSSNHHGASGHLYLEHLSGKSYLTMLDVKRSELTCKDDRDCGGIRSCRVGVCGMLQGPYQVAPGEVWVLGDNRNNSHDSRSWRGGLGGGVPLHNIKGRAMFVWWSWDPRGSLSWDRLFVNVMGTPRVPPGSPHRLLQGLQRCVESAPRPADTYPPAAK